MFLATTVALVLAILYFTLLSAIQERRRKAAQAIASTKAENKAKAEVQLVNRMAVAEEGSSSASRPEIPESEP